MAETQLPHADDLIMVTGELHESVAWMREAVNSGDPARLQDEIRFAFKLLLRASSWAGVQLDVLDDVVATFNGDVAIACELSASPEEKENLE